VRTARSVGGYGQRCDNLSHCNVAAAGVEKIDFETSDLEIL
jgi:hypothetical protein